MIRHLFKLVWHRKRTSALLILEIFFSFLVVFAVAALSLWLLDNYRRPLGFSYEDVWRVQLDVKQESDDTWNAEQVEVFARLLREAQTLDRVVAVAGATGVPYEIGGRSGRWRTGGRDVEVQFESVTDGLAEVLQLELLEGRWFQPSDEALGWSPVVIDLELSRDLFGAQDPIGRRIELLSERDYRVVGVVSDFRRHGELSGAGNFIFYHNRIGDPSDRPPRNLLVRVQPGTRVEFEEQLVQRLQAVAPQWSVTVEPLSRMRETSFRLLLAPIVTGAVVAGFLMLMVGLGLSGVLWQNVVRRTRELGLRRAMGASRRDVFRQILLEVLCLTALGLCLGLVLALQLPLLGLTWFLPAGVYAAGLVAAAATICLLTVVCSLYPAALASRVTPAEALRYE